MSFDLYVFDRDDVPDDEIAIGGLLEDHTRWHEPMTPRLSELVAELKRRYPVLEVDPDSSPWASWPLSVSVAGTALDLNIVWSQADRMSYELRNLVPQMGLVLYDPQTSEVIRPDEASGTEATPTKRRWWRG